jgi:anti-sigma regulatory factor (Ser/Thr protein kinase)
MVEYPAEDTSAAGCAPGPAAHRRERTGPSGHEDFETRGARERARLPCAGLRARMNPEAAPPARPTPPAGRRAVAAPRAGSAPAVLEVGSGEAGLAQARSAADAYLREQWPRADRAAVILVISELLTNAVRHAPGWWRLRLAPDGRDLVVEVADGNAAEPRLRAPDLEGAGGGMGMHIVHKLASRVEIAADRKGRGKTVRAVWEPEAG